jgi:hypothetical protein
VCSFIVVRGLKPTALCPRPVWDACRELYILQLSTVIFFKNARHPKNETFFHQASFLRTIFFEENIFKQYSDGGTS